MPNRPFQSAEDGFPIFKHAGGTRSVGMTSREARLSITLGCGENVRSYSDRAFLTARRTVRPMRNMVSVQSSFGRGGAVDLAAFFSPRPRRNATSLQSP